MSYDEDLANRVRELTGIEDAITEKRMFGGLAFLLNGHLAVGVSGQGGLLVRCDPAESDRLVETSVAEFAVMRGRQTTGWLRVAADDVRTKRQLSRWVRIGMAAAGSMPPK